MKTRRTAISFKRSSCAESRSSPRGQPECANAMTRRICWRPPPTTEHYIASMFRDYYRNRCWEMIQNVKDWQSLLRLITHRSEVQILPPQLFSYFLQLLVAAQGLSTLI